MNRFGEEFYRIYNGGGTQSCFAEDFLELNGRKFSVAQFRPNAAILNNCYKIAREKSRYTMDEGQDLVRRRNSRKLINQFKGIMAEAAVHIFIHQCCGFPLAEIQRWDLEREDFQYASNEYDLKISCGQRNFYIESRSSSSYQSSLQKFMLDYDIIGKYSNEKKQLEKAADLYVRPVFQYSPPYMSGEAYNVRIDDTFEDIKSGRLTLWLVAAAGKKEMYGPKGYQKNMGQGSTRYQCIRIQDAGDMRSIVPVYREWMRG